MQTIQELPRVRDVSTLTAPRVAPEPQRLPPQQVSVIEKLRRENAELTQLLGIAAHELRSPLSSIRGLSEFLRDGAVGPLTPEQLHLVTTIHTASDSMINMVNELLDVSTCEAKALQLKLELWELKPLIRDSIASLTLPASRKGSDFTLTTPDSLPVVRVDGAKMKQVFDNLMSNALKYSPPGSRITIVAEADLVRGTCSVAVRDQGPGIPEHERDRLFQPFSRLSPRPTAGEPSIGLGLAICRRIVEAHSGTITATNLPNAGCEFRVTLPLA